MEETAGPSSGRATTIACIPELVFEVLNSLPARVLHSCAQVNRLWYYVAVSILRRRVGCSTIFIHNRNIERNEAKKFSLNLYSKPKVVFLFTYEDVWINRRERSRRRCAERQLVKSVRYLYDQLPNDCQLLGCTTEKLIFQTPEDFPTGPVHKKRGHVALSFPEVDGVTYYTVHVRHLRYQRRDWSRLFRFSINHPIKLAIVLALPHSRDMIAHIASGVRETFGENVTILGGVGHDRLFMDGTVRRTRALVLLVSGDAFGVRAGFLNQPVRLAEQRTDFYEPARMMIKELEDDNFRPAIALLLTSRFVHRGNSYFSSAHGIFRDNFPTLLSGGFYSYGEFCMSSGDPGRSLEQCLEFMKYNSSVFCVCGYNTNCVSQ